MPGLPVTRRLLLALPLAAALPAPPATAARSFLRLRHAWCPYALPAETTLSEIEDVARRGFDAVGISFVGPYQGGGIDFSTLDAAIALVAKYNARTVIHLAPRFFEADRIADTLHDGTILPHLWNRSPNYSVVDIFDPRQIRLYTDYLSRVARRYGKDARVAGFALGWGYMGETGFFIGDFLADFAQIGATSAGYSEEARREFNRWRVAHGLEACARLPLPSSERQSDDYIAWQRFRAEWVRETFQREMVAAVKTHTAYPVGIFGYIAASPNNYARCWQSTPNADFYRSAGSASSFDMSRTLLDSGVGWEDCELHDGRWDFTAACMRRDEARQIARGGAFHAMHVRVYRTEPQWEPGIYDAVCAFLKSQTLWRDVRREDATIGLFQPTWGMAAIPGHSAKQPFLPRQQAAGHLTKMIGLVESFGLPYRLITETDLLVPQRLRGYRHLLLPCWDVLERVIGAPAYRRLAADRRVVGIPMMDRHYTRAEFRLKLERAGIAPRLDFDSDAVLAGRTANLVYNWTSTALRATVPDAPVPHEFRLL